MIMKTKGLLFGSSSILLLLLSATDGATPPPPPAYLKEILLGRCYERPPLITTQSSAAARCPEIVGNIMNVLESHLDADITTSDFDKYMYMENADFTSPHDHALVYLRFFHDHHDHEPHNNRMFAIPPNLVTPEMTPGGALLHDLVICGIDQRPNNCSIEKSNAYWTFWQSAYTKFTSQVSGHLQIVIEPLADIQFLERTVVPSLEANRVDRVTIYTTHCDTPDMKRFVQSLIKDANIDNTVCKSDMLEFLICQEDKMTSPDECTKYRNDDDGMKMDSPPPPPPPDNKNGNKNGKITDENSESPEIETNDDDDEDSDHQGSKNNKSWHHYLQFLTFVIMGCVIACCLFPLVKNGAGGTFFQGGYERISDFYNDSERLPLKALDDDSICKVSNYKQNDEDDDSRSNNDDAEQNDGISHVHQ